MCTLPLAKISYANSSLKNDYSPILPLFCHEWQRVRVSSKRLIIAGWASIAFILISRSSHQHHSHLQGPQEWKAWYNHPSQPGIEQCSQHRCSPNTHLTQLITENVKASIHALKLHHDVLKCHPAHRKWGSGCGWSWRSGNSCRIGPPRSKLCLTPFNGSVVNSTHNGEVVGRGKRNRKMA